MMWLFLLSVWKITNCFVPYFRTDPTLLHISLTISFVMYSLGSILSLFFELPGFYGRYQLDDKLVAQTGMLCTNRMCVHYRQLWTTLADLSSSITKCPSSIVLVVVGRFNDLRNNADRNVLREKNTSIPNSIFSLLLTKGVPSETFQFLSFVQKT